VELSTLYKHLIAAGGLEEVDGVICYDMAGADGSVRQPVTIGGKSLHLPTQEFLRNPDWEHFVGFHPLSENPMRGESDVLKVLRGYMVANFNLVAMQLMEGLIRLGADKDGHRKLSVAASECLDAVPKADNASVNAMKKIIAEIDKDSHLAMMDVMDQVDNTNRRKLVNFYLKRSGTLKGNKYARVCVVEFPFLADHAVDEGKRSIFGSKTLRVGDFKGFRKLFSFIVDSEESNGEKYNSGTNSMTAPYLTVLVESWAKVANRFNRLIKVYSKYIPELKQYEFDTSWVKDGLASFQELQTAVPAMEGNRGAVELGAEEEKPQAAAEAPVERKRKSLVQSVESKPEVQPQVVEAPAQVVQPAQPQYQQPARDIPHAVAAPQATTGATWRDLTRAQQPQQPPQPQYQQPYYQQQQQYQQPQPGWAAEAFNQRPVNQPPQPVVVNAGNPLRTQTIYPQQQQQYYDQYGRPVYPQQQPQPVYGGQQYAI